MWALITMWVLESNWYQGVVLSWEVAKFLFSVSVSHWSEVTYPPPGKVEGIMSQEIPEQVAPSYCMEVLTTEGYESSTHTTCKRYKDTSFRSKDLRRKMWLNKIEWFIWESQSMYNWNWNFLFHVHLGFNLLKCNIKLFSCALLSVL